MNKESVKPNKASVKPNKASVKPNKASVKPKKVSVKPKKASVKPKKATVKPKKYTGGNRILFPQSIAFRYGKTLSNKGIQYLQNPENRQYIYNNIRYIINDPRTKVLAKHAYELYKKEGETKSKEFLSQYLDPNTINFIYDPKNRKLLYYLYKHYMNKNL